MRISSPVVSSGNELWAAAVEDAVLSEIVKGSLIAGARFECAVPSAVARLRLSAGTGESGVVVQSVWLEDDISLRLEHCDSSPVRMRRERAEGGHEQALKSVWLLPEGLEPTFTGAFAATRVQGSDAFAIREHTSDVIARRRARTRMRLLSGILAASIVLAAVAPAGIATHRAARARMTLAGMRGRQRALVRAQHDLAKATIAINAVNSFAASQRPVTLMLGELALALPESTAITTLRLDTLGGSLSVISPHAAGTLDALSGLHGVGRALLVGPVTREITGTMELEHAALRFVLSRPPSEDPSVAVAPARLAVLSP
ncbi:MAG: hypothetical protein ABIX19_04605 [Gemmatimonadaceae bacterium]